MHADTVCLDIYGLAINADHLVFLGHFYCPCRSLVPIVDNCAQNLAVYQGAIIIVGPVSKDLADDGQPCLLRFLSHHGAGQPHEINPRIHAGHRLGNAPCQLCILGCHVVQCPVGFYMLQLQAVAFGKSHQRSQLVFHIGTGLLRRHRHRPPPEAQQVRKTGMSSHSHAIFCCQCHGLFHNQRVTGMIAACHIDRCNMRHHRLIHAHGIGTEALTQIAVQIHTAKIYTAHDFPPKFMKFIKNIFI